MDVPNPHASFETLHFRIISENHGSLAQVPYEVKQRNTLMATVPTRGKAIGENPISPVAPAIANAVYDAVGVRIQDLPITAEKVLSALKSMGRQPG